ncbi:uncharacterized protein LOC111948256 isoform X1 [Oryzias latipes]|uniref:uncharacterized protein LOC111948256 isoform X1 n=1 Tax=Oryzias latipes TaxID=8090 RepID=UPI000CE25D02|nr:uncharacterized protein LOC111948256 isoform X1 [Oryzias latipes]
MEPVGDKVDDALFLADALIEEFKRKQPAAVQPSGTGPATFVRHEEDEYGNPLPKRRRTGERRKPVSSKRTPTMAQSPTVDQLCMPSTSGQQSVTEPSHDIGSLIKEVQDLLGPAEDPTPSHWTARKASSLEKWTVLRPFMVDQMLQSGKPKGGQCHHCRSQVAVIVCHDCLPRPLYCASCDLAVHDNRVLHNRSATVEGFYRPLPPTTFIKEEGGKLTFHERACLLPVVLPCCDCSTGQTEVSAGKQVILIGMNGRYNLSLPNVTCSCGKTWDVGIGDLVESGYWPATVHFETLYTVDLFTSYEDLKITAPGMSRHAFVGMLEQRTKVFGRSGKICGDTMQKSFLEWSYAKFEVERLSLVHHFKCPACTPSMLAVAVDGNRKLYRFRSQPGPDGFFDGVFLAKDTEVASFVDYIHGATRHNPGKGRCGGGEWLAARESSHKSASKVDEEGVEVAVCRHGVLLKGLNMFRGEIFAYPLFLQKELAAQNVGFFCSDVVCKYWPYLQKVVRHCPELQGLLTMHPFLSIMHAKAHSWMCELQWGGRNQEGAGITMGEEVEQVNSFLSRAAICSKYMSKAVRTDILTIQAIGWNKRKVEKLDQILAKRYIKTAQRISEALADLDQLTKELSIQEDTVQQWVSDVKNWAADSTGHNDLEKTIEGLYLSIKQRKYELYRKADGNKRRHLLRKKIATEKRALDDAITKRNTDLSETEKLPSSDVLLAHENYFWPWECHGDMVKKKQLFDKVMLLTRLKEEKVIVVREVKQHWEYLRNAVGMLEELSSQISEGITEQSNTDALTEQGREGLLCLLKRRSTELRARQDAARKIYQNVLGLQALCLDDSSTDEENLDSSSSDEDI